MRSLLLSFCLILTGGWSFAETIVVDGKPYKIEPTKLDICGEIDSGEYKAVLFLMAAAQSLGEATAKASCQAEDSALCSAQEQKKSGLIQVFNLIRKYPSRFTSGGCASLRDACEKKCETSGLFDGKTCVIECNQYERYNR